MMAQQLPIALCLQRVRKSQFSRKAAISLWKAVSISRNRIGMEIYHVYICDEMQNKYGNDAKTTQRSAVSAVFHLLILFFFVVEQNRRYRQCGRNDAFSPCIKDRQGDQWLFGLE
jgi:hypothetical protein